MSNVPVRRYIRIDNGQPGRGRPIGLIMAQVDGTNIRIGVSLCSPEDQYTRVDAVRLAKESFDRNEFTVPVVGSFNAIREKVKDFLKFSRREQISDFLALNLRIAMKEAIQADWFRINHSVIGKLVRATRNTVLG